MSKKSAAAAIGVMLVAVVMFFTAAMVAWVQGGAPAPLVAAVASPFFVIAWRAAKELFAALGDDTP